MRTSTRTTAVIALALAANCGFAVATPPLPDVELNVDADGNISPDDVTIHYGQQANWTFANAHPANALVRQTWVGAEPGVAPYEPDNPNELMTPLPKGMSGIFVISENQGGLIEQTAPCVAPSTMKASRTIDETLTYLCSSDPNPAAPNYQRTMDSTWANPAVTGVFIRLKWSDIQTGPNEYDDTILLREVDQAVANGKLYSIGIKSGAENDATPAWLFDSVQDDGAGLTEVWLDWNEGSDSCATEPHAYGNPTDAIYRQLYLDMLSHVATVLKEDSARWRSLAYVKISGANARSAENRLPNGCKVGPGCICNNQAWAAAGYTPDGLFEFYEAQLNHIAAEFPDKTMSYSLIQAGFPRVNNLGCYLDESDITICPLGMNIPMPGPFAATNTIIEKSRQVFDNDVAIAHLGLGPKPDFSDLTEYAPGTGCPLPVAADNNLAHGEQGVGSGCPNKWATDVGAVGGLTHFQTNNASGVGNPAELASALDNLWVNSNAAMLEIYEARVWEAGESILDTSLPINKQRTLGEWNARLHERRRIAFPAFGDPAPTSLSFTFTLVEPSFTPTAPEEPSFHYIVPRSGPQPVVAISGSLPGPQPTPPPGSRLGFLGVFSEPPVGF